MKQPDPSDDNLSYYKKLFDESRDLTEDARTQAENCIDYYDGKQLTAAERQVLRARKQPEIVINRTRVAVNGVLGVVAGGHTEPRAWPRTPKDEDSADVATDVLRYIGDETTISAIKLQCFRDMLVPGTMAAIVEIDQDLKPSITQIRWEEFFYDARSRANDFKDARHLGIAKWRYTEDVARAFPDKADDIKAYLGGSMSVAETFDDRPRNQAWADRRRARVLIVEMFVREAKWMRCIFYGGGILLKEESPYLDERGQPMCPIEAQSAYVDRENNRYGIVLDMIGPQDEINKRRSKLLHLISASQIQAVDPSAVEVDAEAARREAAKADGVIPFGWQKVPTTDMASGQMLLLTEAKGEIERLGPNPAILGRQGADSSGRAVLARQQAGMTEMAILFDYLNDWELRIYKQAWARVRQFWKAEQYIRVTDDEDAPKFVAINKPIPGPPTVGYHPETGMPAIIPTVLGYENQIAEMDVDIKLDAQPDQANLMQETLKDLMQLVSSNPTYAQAVPFDVMLELSPIPRKRQLIERLKKYSEAQQQQQAQMQQIQQQLGIADARANIEKTQSETLLNEAKVKAEGIDAFVQLHTAAQPQPVAGGKGESAKSSA